MSHRSIAISGADQQLLTGRHNYRGFALRETSGTGSVTVQVYDDVGSGGTLLDTVQLAAGESRSELADSGEYTRSGVRLDITGPGTVEGAVRVGT